MKIERIPAIFVWLDEEAAEAASAITIDEKIVRALKWKETLKEWEEKLGSKP